MTGNNSRSPDRVQRNPGQILIQPLVSPDFAALHPGYKYSLVYGWKQTICHSNMISRTGCQHSASEDTVPFREKWFTL
jgi:hypothetical protein